MAYNMQMPGMLGTWHMQGCVQTTNEHAIALAKTAATLLSMFVFSLPWPFRPLCLPSFIISAIACLAAGMQGSSCNGLWPKPQAQATALSLSSYSKPFKSVRRRVDQMPVCLEKRIWTPLQRLLAQQLTLMMLKVP